MANIYLEINLRLANGSTTQISEITELYLSILEVEWFSYCRPSQLRVGMAFVLKFQRQVQAVLGAWPGPDSRWIDGTVRFRNLLVPGRF